MGSATIQSAVSRRNKVRGSMTGRGLEEELDGKIVPTVKDDDPVDDDPDPRRQCLAKDDAHKERPGPLEQGGPTETDGHDLGDPSDEDAQPRVADERAVAYDIPHRQQR